MLSCSFLLASRKGRLRRQMGLQQQLPPPPRPPIPTCAFPTLYLQRGLLLAIFTETLT